MPGTRWMFELKLGARKVNRKPMSIWISRTVSFSKDGGIYADQQRCSFVFIGGRNAGIGLDAPG
jgi:hypothetical protein